MNMQKLVLVGRATKDAEIISSKGKKSFASFTIACNRFLGKDKGENVTYYDVISFGDHKVKTAEEKLKKGDLVFVLGRPEVDAYITKEGEARGVLRVVADDWQAIK